VPGAHLTKDWPLKMIDGPRRISWVKRLKRIDMTEWITTHVTVVVQKFTPAELLKLGIRYLYSISAGTLNNKVVTKK
jgi:hypothetical protein